MNNVLMALGLTLFAGMATGIGSLIAFTAKRTNHRFLSVSTGFSAGVMLYVSFIEIFPKGLAEMIACQGDRLGYFYTTLGFFGGMLLIGLIDNLVPSEENPHEPHSDAETALLHEPKSATDNPKLLRMGMFTALAIGIHNFPEGLATFLAAMRDPALGVAIAIAIALHNIPEGISVSVPIYYASGSRRRAFVYSLLSGLAEPIGALVAYLLLILVAGPDAAVPPLLMGGLFAGVAGIMVYISVDELLPTSRAYGKGHDSLLGLVGGMLVMAASLVAMR
ncbi:MAG: zinc transporter ZupT [Lentisphaerae bacterium]|nr:zinc transporter ZupT [Lentisphaerota bacterium]